MINFNEAMKRARLFKSLDTDYKEAKLVYLEKQKLLNDRLFNKNYYLLAENCDYDEEIAYSLIITLDENDLTRNRHTLPRRAYNKKFTAWWISSEHLKVMKESLIHPNKFLYFEEV
mgnify:CR=1 FL=1